MLRFLFFPSSRVRSTLYRVFTAGFCRDLAGLLDVSQSYSLQDMLDSECRQKMSGVAEAFGCLPRSYDSRCCLWLVRLARHCRCMRVLLFLQDQDASDSIWMAFHILLAHDGRLGEPYTSQMALLREASEGSPESREHWDGWDGETCPCVCSWCKCLRMEGRKNARKTRINLCYKVPEQWVNALSIRLERHTSICFGRFWKPACKCDEGIHIGEVVNCKHFVSSASARSQLESRRIAQLFLYGVTDGAEAAGGGEDSGK